MSLVSFVLGVGLGAITVGAATFRTMTVYEGRPEAAVSSSLVVSTTYYFGIMFIVVDDLIGYLGFSLGAAIIIGVMARMRQKKLDSGE